MLGSCCHNIHAKNESVADSPIRGCRGAKEDLFPCGWVKNTNPPVHLLCIFDARNLVTQKDKQCKVIQGWGGHSERDWMFPKKGRNTRLEEVEQLEMEKRDGASFQTDRQFARERAIDSNQAR